MSSKNISSGLKLVNNGVIKVQAKGDVGITASVNGNDKKIRLMDAPYVPDLRTNLLSVAKIVDNRHKVTFTRNRAVVKDLNGNTTIIAERINDLFYRKVPNRHIQRPIPDNHKLKIGTKGSAILI